MKKIILTMMCLMAMAMGASAQQYVSATADKVLTYDVNKDGKKEGQMTVKVESAEAGANGSMTVGLLETQSAEGMPGGKLENRSQVVYDAETGITTYTLMSAEEFKKLMMMQFEQMAAMQGQYLDAEKKAELDQAMKVTGALTLPLDPKAAAATKFANSSLTCRIEGQSFDMRLTKGLYQGLETVEVPAGKFENCIKVSYQLRFVGMGMVPAQQITAWYAPEVGLVKSEEGTKGGKVEQSMELASF